MKEQLCPAPGCDHKLDGAMPADGIGQPGPGDFTVCLYCMTPLRFDDDMQLRTLCTADESEVPAGFYELVESFQRLRDSHGVRAMEAMLTILEEQAPTIQ